MQIFRRSFFRSVQYLIVFNLKSQSHIQFRTAFVQCCGKWFLLKLGTSWARLEKCMTHSAQKVNEQIGDIFKSFNNNGILFSHFSDSRPKKIGFGAWGRFCMFSLSKKSSIYLQFCEFSIKLVWSVIKIDRIYAINNMALAVFINNCKKIEIFVKGVSGKSGFFLIALPIQLPIELPIELPRVLGRTGLACSIFKKYHIQLFLI